MYLLVLAMVAFVSNVTLFADSPEAWQMGFQDPATPIMEGIINLHHDITFFLAVIITLVSWVLYRAMYMFHESRNPKASQVSHGTFIEIVWTILPSFVLLAIAVPSFALLYAMDEVIDPAITIKAIGHQW
ncbi:MAG: cytochrome c oxidase subunit II transmembrane domain-containing protein, partial [Sediminibacterium sp.]|uniref:cytochrome c oxidase subunit II transmembrane domain-containing protein n=1 Tax=Sediminibacterium sp. TaxID=1917865 RepID=UPI0027172E69